MQTVRPSTNAPHPPASLLSIPVSLPSLSPGADAKSTLPGKLPAGLSLSQRQSLLPGDSDQTMSYLLPGTEGRPANGNFLPPDSGPRPSCHFHGLSLHALDTLSCSRVTVLEPFPGVECEHALGAPQPFLLACICASPVLAQTRNSMVAE